MKMISDALFGWHFCLPFRAAVFNSKLILKADSIHEASRRGPAPVPASVSGSPLLHILISLINGVALGRDAECRRMQKPWIVLAQQINTNIKLITYLAGGC